MSNRKSICVTSNAHLYEDLREEDNLFIELEDIGECSFELWTTLEDTTASRAVVKISKEDFEKMIDAYRSQEN
tara:strand:- start:268 stop:486 length:219 start_codon:yes stop_codon:yes gene_type:complete